MTNHHDIFFKKVFSDKANSIDFSKHTLRKELAANLDYESFRLENVSYVDEHLAEYFSDVVYTSLISLVQNKISIIRKQEIIRDNR